MVNVNHAHANPCVCVANMVVSVDMKALYVPCCASVDLFYREFGMRLREARQRRELTQEGLAEQVGMSRASIANIELGRQRVPLHMIRNFADALTIESVELLPTGPATEDTAAAGLDRLHPENHDDVLRILRRGRQEREVEHGETTRR